MDPAWPEWQLPAGVTLVVDEAGMLATHDLYHLTSLEETERWRLVLVGDPAQLQAVARGGMFNELCATGRPYELERIHRFSQPWEPAASLALRTGNPGVLDTYEQRGRIVPGDLHQHLDTITRRWADAHAAGRTVAVTATTNEHVALLNGAIQRYRLTSGHTDPQLTAHGADGIDIYLGDVIVTRRNNRRGLYVAMTRGQDLNVAFVVTPEPSIEAARTVLEGVLASDRADVPAVTQRRNLAAQAAPAVRTPQPVGRCQIPDWWADLHTATVDDLNTVNTAIDTIDSRQESERDDMEAADCACKTAKRNLQPTKPPTRPPPAGSPQPGFKCG